MDAGGHLGSLTRKRTVINVYYSVINGSWQIGKVLNGMDPCGILCVTESANHIYILTIGCVSKKMGTSFEVN